MKTTEVRTFDAGRRVQGFLDTNAPTIGTAVPPSLRAKFDAAVSQIVQFQHEQEAATAAAKGETVNQAALRSDLFKHLVAPIGKVAKINLRQSNDLPALVVPAAAQRRKDFVAKVNTLADTASKYEPMFVEHGLPADFIAQIRAGATAVAASAVARERQQSGLSAATKGLAVASKSVHDLIGVLNGILAKLFKTNLPLAADWKASKKIRQAVVTPLPTGGLVASGISLGPPATTPPASPSSAATPSAPETPAKPAA